MNTVESLFDISGGHQLALNRVAQVRDGKDAIAYVSRSARNNGVAAWVKRIEGLGPACAGDISVSLRSRNHALAAFVQPRAFYTTYHVAILRPRKVMSLQEKLWWCLCIRANRFRFHFGRQANRTLGSLVLPHQVPDWAKATKIDDPTHDMAMIDRAPIDTSKWKSFQLSDLFDMAFGPHSSKRDLGHGDTSLVTASAWNNGVSAQVAVSPNWSGGQITVANNGSVGAAFYQPQPFTASRDVTILEPRTKLTAPTALFICTVLRRESLRFNYARKWNAGRMRDSMIKLPASNGEPDFGTMEAFMKDLPLGWSLG